MPVHDLLLEIGCEEIPSRFIPGAVEQLKEEGAALLEEYRLGYSDIDAWGTPRRLTLLVSRLESRQPDIRETVKGPPRNRAYDEAGNPTPALLGFARSRGITPDEVQFESIKGAEYAVVHKEVPGRSALEILPELLPLLLRRISFPRPMYWESKEIRFARPIRWLLALYGSSQVTFEFAGITAGRLTYGHRFLAPGPFTVESPAHYFSCLEENYVLINHKQRREAIRRMVEGAAAACGGAPLVDETLLEEVTFLVEYPEAITGMYDPAYLDLPREVLITTMQVHQRYFPVAQSREQDAPLLPFFIGISNNRYHDNIKKGYEKVLQARLADARFFYDEDRKRPLESYVEQLSGVIFQESLGTMDQKRERLVRLVGAIGERLALPPELLQNARRAAHLCKADLVTNMVGEFPELQGVMGRVYARLGGEPEAVAEAIYQHYLPRYGGDDVPSTREGALVSLADRIDTLVGCFAVGIQPTGSQDPYALRRQAQGIVAVLLEHDLDLAPADLVEEALQVLDPLVRLDPERRLQLQENLHEFFNQRLRFMFQERGLSHDVVEAVLAVPYRSVAELFRRASALEEQLRNPVLADVVTAYNRVANLARRAGGEPVDLSLFEEPAEEELFRKLSKTEPALLQELKRGQYSACLRLLQSLKEPIDGFFDGVLVMAEDEKLRSNRLNLLYAIRELFNRMADFSLLQGF